MKGATRSPISAALPRRLLATALTLLLVHGAAFLLLRGARGGPFDEERALAPEVQRALAERYHLDEPLPRQYWRSLTGALRGDFGPSLRYRGHSVRQILAAAAPLSLSLGGLALALALLLGVPAGLAAAARPGGPADRLLLPISSLVLALPSFVLAGAGILLFSFALPWLPPAGTGGLRHLVLPAISLALPLAAQIARLVRGAAVEALRSDAVRAARARGIPPRSLLRRHVLPRAILPVLAFLGPAAAGLLTGSLVVEQVFALPGLGVHFVQAALNRDYTLALGVTLLYTALLSLCTLAADVLIRRLDPRVEAMS